MKIFYRNYIIINFFIFAKKKIMNQLLLGDNLEIMKKMENEIFDLIYLDPPFFTGKNQELIWGEAQELRSYKDRWAGGIMNFIEWLKPRVEQMHRLLKPTGAIFLHCDYHANSYIRCFILDKIFGANNFRNEIVWKRTSAKSNASKKLPVLKDSIFYYTKTDEYTYYSIFTEHSEKYKKAIYCHENGKGFYSSSNLTAPTNKPKNEEWKGYNPASRGRSWGIPREIVIELVGEEKAKKMSYSEKLDLLYENNLIEFTKNGVPRLKLFLNPSKGVMLGDWWDDISNVTTHAKERIGYPTQKPEKLLERIISCASNEGDFVLDPFLGSGTTVCVADKLNRNWVGIDELATAISVSEMRLQKQADILQKPFVKVLHKYDYETVRNSDAFDFEGFAVRMFGGIENLKKRGDKGVDGKTKDGIPIQVKRQDSIGREYADNFHAAIIRNDRNLYEKNRETGKPVGFLIAFSFGKGLIEEIARLKSVDNVIIELIRVDSFIPFAKKPSLKLEILSFETDKSGLTEISFKAEGVADENKKIEFYAWDFSFEEKFSADIYIDKDGLQKYKFTKGIHKIAAKVVDNDGLETLETITLHINGGVNLEK